MDLSHLRGSLPVVRAVPPLRDTISRDQLIGMACTLIGVSQLPLAFELAALSNQYTAMFVIGSAGWLLIGIGINLLLGRAPFQTDWTDNPRAEWILAAVLVGQAIVVVLAAGATLLPD